MATRQRILAVVSVRFLTCYDRYPGGLLYDDIGFI